MAEQKKSPTRSRASAAPKADPTAELKAQLASLQKELADLKASLAAHCKKSDAEHAKLAAACDACCEAKADQSSGKDEDARDAIKLLKARVEGKLPPTLDLTRHRSWKI